MKKIAFLIVVILLPILVFANVIVSGNVPSPTTKDGNFVTLNKMIKPGYPKMAYIPVRILIPQGEVVDEVSLQFGTVSHQLRNQQIDFANENIPISSAKSVLTNHPTSNEFFPLVNYENLGVQTMKGYDILILNVYPYKYNSKTKEIVWYENYDISVKTHSDRARYETIGQKLLKNASTIQEITGFVANPELISSYQRVSYHSQSRLVDPNNPYKMIIITDDTRAPYFTEFVNWKNSHQIPTGVFTTSYIYTNYTGSDNQAKIRNFILDAYNSFASTSTPLEYVFLGGDNEVIPIRGAYGEVGSYVDFNIPCDMYYVCLDGSWNGNNNGVYGEANDNTDMLPELAVGRIPAENLSQFQNFFNKVYYYTDVTSYSNDIAYMFGELLNPDPLTYGDDYKNEIIPRMPDTYHFNTLYERDGTYSGYNVMGAINSGLGIINHMGHANETMVFGINASSTSNLTNTEYGFAYSQGCYPAAFDLPAAGGESVAENLVTGAGGLFAFVGNTRYGWYMPGSTDGASQFFDRTFFDALYAGNIRQMGSTLNQSKIDLVNDALSNSVMRWVYYEMILFGDPSISVKDASGTFPFLQPGNVTYLDDLGDQDGVINPGESIKIFVNMENLPGWNMAQNVTASISFDNPMIDVDVDSVSFGNIPASGNATNIDPFIINIPLDLPYDTYYYYITVYAPVNGGYFKKTYKKQFSISLFAANWPLQMNQVFNASPLIYDLDNNGQKDILIHDATGNIYGLNSNATMLPGYPFTDNDNIYRSAAMGDINNDNQPEIVLANRNNSIYAKSLTGTTLFNFTDCRSQFDTPMIADINNDGQKEVISVGIDKKLQVLHANGVNIPNFPVTLSSLVAMEMAVGDINNDGLKEIVVATIDRKLHVINNNGTDITGFPVTLSSVFCGAPTILEDRSIVVGTSDNKVSLISPAGEVLFTRSINSKMANSAIIADVNNDGQTEIIFTTENGMVYVLNHAGNDLSGWPVETGQSFSTPPLAVDMNNDGFVDIIAVTKFTTLYIWDYQAVPFSFTPVNSNYNNATPAIIEDLNNDGDYDVIAGIGNGLVVFDCKLPKGNKNPWSMYRGNMARTGNYNYNLYVDNAEVDVPFAETTLKQNYPNPFNPSTAISYSIAENSKVELAIYNIKGQKVKTLVNENKVKGNHSVTWNGKDQSNKKVSSGIYFYKLETANKTLTKKMILMK